MEPESAGWIPPGLDRVYDRLEAALSHVTEWLAMLRLRSRDEFTDVLGELDAANKTKVLNPNPDPNPNPNPTNQTNVVRYMIRTPTAVTEP